jgi:alcohol dehydrogenase (cytochrome c)
VRNILVINSGSFDEASVSRASVDTASPAAVGKAKSRISEATAHIESFKIGKRRRHFRSLVKLLLCMSPLAIAACTVARADAGATSDGNWPSYNRSLASDRFSSLDEIDRENVTKLVRKCEYRLPAPTSFQTGPLAIDGVLFFTSPAARSRSTLRLVRSAGASRTRY